jgi:hypothetical protein
LYVVYVADLVAVGFFVAEVDVFGDTFALPQLVHDGVGRGRVGFGWGKAHVGCYADEHVRDLRDGRALRSHQAN